MASVDDIVSLKVDFSDKTLQQAFDFTQADLVANQYGQLSDQQNEKYITAKVFVSANLNWKTIGLFGLFAVTILLFFLGVALTLAKAEGRALEQAIIALYMASGIGLLLFFLGKDLEQPLRTGLHVQLSNHKLKVAGLIFIVISLSLILSMLVLFVIYIFLSIELLLTGLAGFGLILILYAYQKYRPWFKLNRRVTPAPVLGQVCGQVEHGTIRDPEQYNRITQYYVDIVYIHSFKRFYVPHRQFRALQDGRQYCVNYLMDTMQILSVHALPDSDGAS